MKQPWDRCYGLRAAPILEASAVVIGGLFATLVGSAWTRTGATFRGSAPETGKRSTDVPQMRDLEAFGRLQSEAQHTVETGMAHPECAEGRENAPADNKAYGEQGDSESINVNDVVHDGTELRPKRIARETDIGQEEKDHGPPPGDAVIQIGKEGDRGDKHDRRFDTLPDGSIHGVILSLEVEIASRPDTAIARLRCPVESVGRRSEARSALLHKWRVGFPV